MPPSSRFTGFYGVGWRIGLLSPAIVGTVVSTRRSERSTSGQRVDLPFLSAEHSGDRHTLRLKVQPLRQPGLEGRSPRRDKPPSPAEGAIFTRGAVTLVWVRFSRHRELTSSLAEHGSAGRKRRMGVLASTVIQALGVAIAFRLRWLRIIGRKKTPQIG
jgi:hypothetical protein